MIASASCFVTALSCAAKNLGAKNIIDSIFGSDAPPSLKHFVSTIVLLLNVVVEKSELKYLFSFQKIFLFVKFKIIPDKIEILIIEDPP